MEPFDKYAEEVAKELTLYLEVRCYDFIDMEWSGNEYTGEGKEYPVVNRHCLEIIIKQYFNSKKT